MTSKPRLSELGLHPGLVEDVVDDLLSSDIISKDNVQKLKNDSYSNLDPNIVMDMRHIQKKEKKELDKCVESITLKRLTNDKCNTPENIKCLKIIDKEIANTRKHLYTFQNQLKKKNESLMSSICNLEKEEDTNLKRKNDYLLSSICNLKNEVAMRRSPLIVNLNEDEIKHYFNMHLDQLEEAVCKNLPKDHSKIWHPLEFISPPIIKVTTTIKLEDFKQSINNDGLKIKELPEDIPICVKGKILPVLSSGGIKQKIEQRTVVPNNSPDLGLDNSTERKESATATEGLKEAAIGRNVINSWKYYIRRNKIKRLSEKMEFKVRTGLLKHVLRSWSLYAKHCKKGTQSELNQPREKTANYSKKEIISLNKTILKNDLRKIGPDTVIPIQRKTDSTSAPNFCKKNLTARKNSVTFSPKADLKHPACSLDNLKRLTFDDVKTINNTKVIGFSGKSDVKTKTDVKLNKKNTIQTNTSHKTAASVIKPFVKSKNFNFPGNLNIDLSNQSSVIAGTNTSTLTTGDAPFNKQTSPVLRISRVPEPNTCPYSKPVLSHRILTPDGVGLDSSTTRKSSLVSNPVVATNINPNCVENRPREPLANRYAAQEKVIAKQMGIIEKQKQLILDLKAKQLEIASKLSLKSAESQLAQAPVSFSRRLQPVMKTMGGDCGHKPAKEEKKKQVNSEIKDKSEKLTKSLLERQEYCKQLAEMTKMRKIRADEERERLKLEEEEKRRQEKEEKRMLNILKMKKEKQLALENARNGLAIQLKTKEMIEKAISHFNNVSIKKSFRALKQNHFEVKTKTHHCRQMFQTNLLKRVLVCWREEAQKSIQLKNVSAEKHYSTKLMINCWNMWCQVRDSLSIKCKL